MTTLTDEQVARIQTRHDLANKADRHGLSCHEAHLDRAALLSHVKALKAEIAELREVDELIGAIADDAANLSPDDEEFIHQDLARMEADGSAQAAPSPLEGVSLLTKRDGRWLSIDCGPQKCLLSIDDAANWQFGPIVRNAVKHLLLQIAKRLPAEPETAIAQAAPSAFCSACGMSRADYLIKGCDGVDGAPDEKFSGCKMLDRHPAPAQTAVLTDEELLKLCNEILNGEPAPYETFGQIHTQVTVARAIIDRLTQQGDKL